MGDYNTPEKRDNNYLPHRLTPTSCLRNNIQLILSSRPVVGVCNVLKHALALRLVWLVPHFSVS